MQSALELKQLLGEKKETEEKCLASGREEENSDFGMMKKRCQILEKRQKHLEKDMKFQKLLIKIITAILVFFLVITMAVSCSLSGKIKSLNISGLAETMKEQETKLEDLKNIIENLKARLETETETGGQTETETGGQTETETESQTKTETEEQTEMKTALAIKENLAVTEKQPSGEFPEETEKSLETIKGNRWS